MFDISIYKSEYTQVCSVCLTNTITLYYTREEVTRNEIVNDLIREGWLNIDSIDDLYWEIFRCEFCRNAAIV